MRISVSVFFCVCVCVSVCVCGVLVCWRLSICFCVAVSLWVSICVYAIVSICALVYLCVLVPVYGFAAKWFVWCLSASFLHVNLCMALCFFTERDWERGVTLSLAERLGQALWWGKKRNWSQPREGVTLPGCMFSGKLLHLTVPQFSHLLNKDNNVTYFIGLLGGFMS